MIMASTRFEPIEGPTAWTGAKLSRSDEWIYSLSAEETAAIERLASELRNSGTSYQQIERDKVTLGALAPAVRAWREALHRGRGFVLIRGLPVERLSEADAAAVYWTIGLHLGTPVPQNFHGELL